MRSTKALAPLLLIGLLCFCCFSQREQEWRYFGTSKNNKHYYDTNSIKRLSTNVLTLWVKYVPVDLALEQATAGDGQTDPVKILKYKQYACGLTLFEVNCQTKAGRVRRVDDYAQDGSLIQSAELDDENSKWLKGPFFDGLSKRICKE